MSPLTRKAAPSVMGCLSIFLLDAKSRRLSPKSIGFYEQQLTYFLRWLEENGVSPDACIADLDRNDICQFLSDRTEEGLAAGSVDASYQALNAFCNFCGAEGWVDMSAMANVKRPRKKEEKIPPAYTGEEIETLLKTCDSARDKAIVLFLLDTGCRAQEMLDLNVDDVDLGNGSVNIRRGKGAKQGFAFIGFRTRKARRNRSMPLRRQEEVTSLC